MNIGIFGSTSGKDQAIIQKAKEIGQLLASKGHTITTGGTEGYPYAAAKSALENNGKVNAYVVGKSLEDHSQYHKVDLSNYSKIIFQEKYFDKELSLIDNYFRSLKLCLDIDAAIVLGGRVGSLYETTITSAISKNIYILKNSGGITDKTMHSFLEEGHKTNSEIIFFDEVDELDKLLD